MRERSGVEALRLTATTPKALKPEGHKALILHTTPNMSSKLISHLLLGARRYSQAQTVVCLKDPKELKMGSLAFSQMKIQGFTTWATSGLTVLSKQTFFPRVFGSVFTFFSIYCEHGIFAKHEYS